MGFDIKCCVKGEGGASEVGVEGEVAEVGGKCVVCGGREESVEEEKGVLGTLFWGVLVMGVIMVEGGEESKNKKNEEETKGLF